MPDNSRNSAIWPIPLSQIEEIVSAHLGPGRFRSNAAAPCLSRQVSMYLAKHVGGWSLPRIGRFYNGRHHTTVLHAIAKIERLRNTDEAIDALLEVLAAALRSEGRRCGSDKTVSSAHSELIDAVAARVIERLKDMAMPVKHNEPATITELALSATINDLPSPRKRIRLSRWIRLLRELGFEFFTRAVSQTRSGAGAATTPIAPSPPWVGRLHELAV